VIYDTRLSKSGLEVIALELPDVATIFPAFPSDALQNAARDHYCSFTASRVRVSVQAD